MHSNVAFSSLFAGLLKAASFGVGVGLLAGLASLLSENLAAILVIVALSGWALASMAHVLAFLYRLALMVDKRLDGAKASAGRPVFASGRPRGD